MTTNLSDSNTSTTAVHSESQIVSPSTLSSFLRDSYASGIQKALADREGQESSTGELSCSMVCADMEGVKLDLLILQKKIEENANLLSANIKKTRGTHGIDYKTRYEHLLSTLRKKKRKPKNLRKNAFPLKIEHCPWNKRMTH